MKYIKTYLITFIICFSLLFLVILIPKKYIKENTIDAAKYYASYVDTYIRYFISGKNVNNLYDYDADSQTVSIIYNLDSKKPFKSLVEMNKYNNTFSEWILIPRYMENDSDYIVNYSRYWHGEIVIIKPLLMFLKYNQIYDLFAFILLILFSILLIMLFKRSKTLGVSYGLGMIIVKFLTTAYCFEYFFVFLISMITSIILLKMYDKKSKNIPLLFGVTGMITCFTDFLSCETITLTVPLFIYSYLRYKDKDPIKFKEFFKLAFIWLIYYALMFISKWGLIVLHYGGGFREYVLDRMFLRTTDFQTSFISMYVYNLYNTFTCLAPVYELIPVVYIFILVGILLFIFKIKNKHNYYPLVLLSLIPFVRYLLLGNHVWILYFMTYRALLPFIILLIIIYMESFKKKIN